MIKLTVLYNLPPGADHEEFMKWRTTTHQKSNTSIPGVIKTDFYVIQSAWKEDKLPYRYMTEAYFPDMETFESSFFDPDYQTDLAKALERIADPMFLISEEVISENVGRSGACCLSVFARSTTGGERKRVHRLVGDRICEATMTTEPASHDTEIAATRGVPSLVWRAGQERRMEMIRRWVDLDDSRVLVDGCGVGMYVRAIREHTPHVFGLDIEAARVSETRDGVRDANLQVAVSERLPYSDGSFDVVLSHEVMEHVDDDRQMLVEVFRVLRNDGRLILFCPNRLYPFETHGHYWHGRYHFGNTPLINWLPNRWRNRLAPHVKAYTGRDLRGLLADIPVRVVFHTQVYPGFDNVVASRPAVGRWLRRVMHALERTPLRVFGLSHFLVVEKVGRG